MAACYQTFEYSPTAAAERPPQPRERARPVVMNGGFTCARLNPSSQKQRVVEEGAQLLLRHRQTTPGAARPGGRAERSPEPTVRLSRVRVRRWKKRFNSGFISLFPIWQLVARGGAGDDGERWRSHNSHTTLAPFSPVSKFPPNEEPLTRTDPLPKPPQDAGNLWAPPAGSARRDGAPAELPAARISDLESADIGRAGGVLPRLAGL